MSKLVNARLARISAAVTAYAVALWGKRQAKFEPTDQTVSDILTDLMHFCRSSDLDFNDLLRRARNNFGDEDGDGDAFEQDARRLEERA